MVTIDLLVVAGFVRFWLARAVRRKAHAKETALDAAAANLKVGQGQ
jgi:hypothetical protein